MLKQFTTALSKALGFISTSINKVSGVTKPCRRFLTWLFERWWMLPVRYNFLNLSRYGGYSEKAIRTQMSRKLPFVALFHELFKPLRNKKCICAFDPSFVCKGGGKTYGLDKFWDGVDKEYRKGLEAGCLSIIDIEDRTAYCLEVVQTPAGCANLMDHYTAILKRRKEDIVPYTSYLTVDGFFIKKGFIGAMQEMGLQVITKARHDSNMLYLYKGPRSKGRGRPRRFAGKINLNQIDKRRWKVCYCNEELIAYELVVWSVRLRREVKAIYLWYRQSGSYAILLSTDTTLDGEVIVQYYGLRFQIEFLIRDAKTYTGLEHCQGRSEEKLYNHFNMALFSVSAIKWLVWTRLPDHEQIPFSMRSIKTYFMNKFLTETIFLKLGLELKNKKIKQTYWECLNIGAMAA